MFYTYFHRKPGVSGAASVFYIGKGAGKRAWARGGRSAYWRNVVAKYGIEVQAAAEWPDEASAFEHEKFLIACFRDLGAPLVNMTDGGEGHCGLSPSAETRAKVSAKVRVALTGTKRSAETRARISASQIGRVPTAVARANMSAAAKRLLSDPVVRHSRGDATRGTTLSEERKQGLRDAWVVRKAVAEARA